MKRNCNLELRLFPMSDHDHDDSSMENFSNQTQNEQEQQKLTIFYNGNVCVCDVTEFQAKAILLLANKDVEEKQRSSSPKGSSSEASSPTTTLASPIYSTNINSGLSMKKSLQRFLQKRNNRIQATHPYSINRRRVTCRMDH